jgi:hypothetical protein
LTDLIRQGQQTGEIRDGDASVLANGRYTLAVDIPDGLRCSNIYYGQIVATRDIYAWDATILADILSSAFDAGCDGNPGTQLTHSHELVCKSLLHQRRDKLRNALRAPM